MSPYSFHLPGINKLTGISKEDWNFLCEVAAENKVSPEIFAAQIVAAELAEIRHEIRYIEAIQQELDVLAERQEKSVEEALS